VDINAFDIKGLGSRTIQTLLDLGMVKSFGDIFRLERYRSTLVTGKVLTEKTAAKMMDSIEKARQISDLKFLTALHIPGIREDAARRILKQWSIHDLLKMGEHSENLYQLTAAEGIGPQVSACFFLWFENDSNVEMLKDLLKEVTIREQSKEETGNRCAGLTFVTTGKLYFYKNRDALKQYIFSEGGNFSETLNANVSYLINNDLNSPSSKNKKAKSLGIPIISEQQFLDEFSDGAVK
jgi:DNA ligase (NAD+)